MVRHIQGIAFISSDENVSQVCEFSAELTAPKNVSTGELTHATVPQPSSGGTRFRGEK